MKAFLTGGAKSGKSHFAQELAVKLSNGGARYYVATMLPSDAEDYERIRKHLLDRDGMGFETLECPKDLMTIPELADPDAVFLVDSITALLQNAMFPAEKGYAPDMDTAVRCRENILRFAESVRNVVFVGDYLYSDAELYDEVTEMYRYSLSSVDRTLAQKCDIVLEFTAGQMTVHKGNNLL